MNPVNGPLECSESSGSESFEKVHPEHPTNQKVEGMNPISVNPEAHCIYQRLLLDVDESVSKPLQSLCQMDDAEEVIQFIESTELLFRPTHLLSTNLENDVLIEGRSDTASINAARIKNSNLDDNRFPGLLNMDESDITIADVDEVDDIEDISDDSDEDRVGTDHHHDEVVDAQEERAILEIV